MLGCLSEHALAEFILSPSGHKLSPFVRRIPVTLGSLPKAIHRGKYLTGKPKAELILVSVGQ